MKSYDLLIWITLRRFWSGCKQVLVIVESDTVATWRPARFG